MNMKASLKYQLHDGLKPFVIFASIVVAANLLIATVITVVVNAFPQHFSNMTGTLGGSDSAAAIFIFILGLSSFKDTFFMHLQHGTSRRTQFWARNLAAVVMAFALALATKLLQWILAGYAAVAGTFRAVSTFGDRHPMDGAGGQLTHIVFLFAGFLFLISLGFFVTLLFYRLNRAGKVAVGIGVPVALLVLYPVADTLLLKGAVTRFLLDAYTTFFGAPWPAIGSYVALAAVFSALGWLLMRRAVVKG